MVRVSRSRAALPSVAIALGAGSYAWSVCRSSMSFTAPPRNLRAPRGSLRAAAEDTTRLPGQAREEKKDDETKTWQANLDTAFLDVDSSPDQRLNSLLNAVSKPYDILESVVQAGQVVLDKGIKDGHPEAIESIFPKGTLARKDLEGLLAVARQAPEVIDDLSRGERTATSTPKSFTPLNVTRLLNLTQLTENVGKLLTPDTFTGLAQEVFNAARETPKGLEEPAYNVAFTGLPNFIGEGFEIRSYESFTVARRDMTGVDSSGSFSAEGFNSLAGYLFGDNENETAMKMTMPVEIGYDSTTNFQTRDMSFVLPSENVMEGIPQPRDANVTIEAIPARLLAVLRFPGVATDQEVRRQVDKLYASLEEDASYAPADKEKYSVLQYNPPYTLPWRRRNEVATVVKIVPAVAAAATRAKRAEAAKETSRLFV